MLSGAELNQLLMPAKFGAVLCRAATATAGGRRTSPIAGAGGADQAKRGNAGGGGERS